jgi:hypothetical protein
MCTETKAVSLDRQRVFDPPMRDEGEVVSIFLVDSEKGFKRTWLEEDYDGVCTVEGDDFSQELNCVQKSILHSNPSTLIINLFGRSPHSFTYVAQTPYAVYSYAGTCTEA